MRLRREDCILYAVTDRHWTGEKTLAWQIEQALQGGVTMVQLREKNLSEDEFEKEALEIQKLCRKYGVPFLINDNVELAKKIGADGVHVGQSDMVAGKVREYLGADKIVGVTAKTVEQAKEAELAGADYLGSGAVFGSGTKLDTSKMDHDLFQKICESVKIPVVAIGGITAGNIMELQGRHAAGVAVVSGIFAADDIKETTRDLRKKAEEIRKEEVKMKTALTIAGSDSSGGAGIQADIKTMMANGVYAMSAITALTAQNTMGVTGIMEVTPEFLGKQLDCVFTDIYPDAVKTGMVASVGLIEMIAEKLKEYHVKNIVVDPVMVATSGARLISEEAIDTLKKEILPIATVITPNIPEAEVLTGLQIQAEEEMIQAAKQIYETYGCAVLCKGGHQVNDANDLLYDQKGAHWFYGKRIDNPNTHGTGCTLSSAIASNLAKGYDLETSVKRAKNYISGALHAQLNLGKGSGPMDHAYAIGELEV